MKKLSAILLPILLIGFIISLALADEYEEWIESYIVTVTAQAYPSGQPQNLYDITTIAEIDVMDIESFPGNTTINYELGEATGSWQQTISFSANSNDPDPYQIWESYVAPTNQRMSSDTDNPMSSNFNSLQHDHIFEQMNGE